MPRKTKIIFIVVFILVGAGMLSYYFYRSKSSTPATSDGTNSGYQPFLGGNTSTSQGTSAGTDANPPSSDTTVSVPPGEVAALPSKFHQITDFPVAGATFFEDMRPLPVASDTTENTGQASETVKVLVPKTLPKDVKKAVKNTKITPPKFEVVPALRYVERITGHIDEIYLDTKTVGKISNSTIPSIYEAVFDGSASSVIYRYLGTNGQTITSFLATLGNDSGEFLPSDILDVSISPDKTKFFSLIKTQNGVVGTTRSFKDTKKAQIFTSPFTEWLSQWVTDQKIYLTTKASASVEGSTFSLNIGSGVLTKVFGGVRGLTTLANKDGSLLLYSVSLNTSPNLGIFDVKSHTTSDLTLEGLPEKCVWEDTIIYCAVPNNATEGGYPDKWYQGLVSFDDRFVKIDTTTNDVVAIADSTDGIPVDATHLFLDKAGTQLFFINKKDATLWSLDLN